MPFEIRIWSVKIIDGREKESSGKVVLKNQMIENDVTFLNDWWLANANVVDTKCDSYAGIRSSDWIDKFF